MGRRRTSTQLSEEESKLVTAGSGGMLGMRRCKWRVRVVIIDMDSPQRLTQFVSDIKANGMTDAEMQIWNEPDLSIFWAKSARFFFLVWVSLVRKLMR